MPLPEAVRKKIAAAQSKLGSSGVKWLTLEAGKPVDIHVINGEYGVDGLWYVKQGIHYLGEGKDQTRVTCPRVTADRDCPICEAAKAIKDEVSAKKRDLDAGRKSMSEADVKALETEIAQLEEMADSLYVSVRFVFNVVVKGESTVRLFNCPKTVFEEIFNTWAKNAEMVDMFDPKSSYYFTVERTGTGQNDTRYKVTPNMVAIPLAASQDAIDKILAGRHDLNNEIKVPTYAEVKTTFDKYMGGDTGGGGGGGSSPAPTQPTPAPKVEEKPAAPAASPTTPAGDGLSPAARLKAKLASAAK